LLKAKRINQGALGFFYFYRRQIVFYFFPYFFPGEPQPSPNTPPTPDRRQGDHEEVNRD
jgi:hypothetical protein